MNTSSLQQFVIIAYDGIDADALNRRLAVREAHLENMQQLKATGNFVEGGAILNDQGNMIGSVVIVAFTFRNELEEWLKNDPYVTGKVWQKIEVQSFRCAPL
jgi:uncharacterized protein YciI